MGEMYFRIEEWMVTEVSFIQSIGILYYYVFNFSLLRGTNNVIVIGSLWQ